ncbi:MAG: cation:dicarboxylate symporter family transporter, partial [Acidimicrobiia bacterium]
MATTATANSKPRISPTAQIMIGLVVGLIAGILINNYNRDLVEVIRPFSQIFIRMIRMIIAPLLFGTLVAGIAGAGHFKDVGRMGLQDISASLE